MFKWTIILLLGMFAIARSNEIELARELLKQQGMQEISEAFWLKQIDDSKQSDHKNLNDTVWLKVKNELNEKDAFLNEMAKIIADNFSEAELKDLIEISKSKTFQKYMDFQKQAGNKFGMAAMELGRKLGNEITKYLKDNKYIKQ